jgi:hypothetical protein
MKKTLRTFLVLLIATGVVGGLIFAYLETSKEREAHAERDQAVVAKSRVKSGANGETILALEREAQARIALRAEPLRPARFRPELRGFARTMDPAPLVAWVAELASAQAALAASEKEFERVKRLNDQANASDRALQAVEATARRDHIAVESIHLRLVSAWGTAIAEQPDLAVFVRSLASLESALVRIDLPAGQMPKATPAGARIVLASVEGLPIPAQWLGPAPNVDPQMQGQGFLFLVKTNSQRLAPGSAASGYLQFEGEPVSGCIVPDSAVVRHAGRGWVYLQTGEDTFTRREIALDHRVEDGWFVSTGVAANQRVVVQGAQVLLSEEQKRQIKLFD